MRAGLSNACQPAPDERTDTPAVTSTIAAVAASQRMLAGADYLAKHSPRKGRETSYYYYHANQVMYHLQGDYWKNWENRDARSFADSAFETVTIFGNDKKKKNKKNKRGSENIYAFGGVEINLTQADINGTATIEVVQLFGGTKIIVPPHWKVLTDELVCVFGSLEDKRQVAGSVVDGSKILVLKGTCIFGGIDLKSF